MRKHKILASLVLVFCVGALIFVTVLADKPQAQQKGTKDKDFSKFPITDLHAKEPDNLDLRAAREKKGRKYSEKLAPITEDTSTRFYVNDWEMRLPAFPLKESDAVVIGNITNAAAYLTSDKTGVYSEFQLDIDVVVVSDPDKLVDAGRTITVERKGGRVRTPSGKFVNAWVSRQDMPRVGGRYVLFLSHSFETKDDMGKGFYILTGYELKDGQVQPIDDLPPSHPIGAYAGKSESAFLEDLFNSVKNLASSK